MAFAAAAPSSLGRIQGEADEHKEYFRDEMPRSDSVNEFSMGYCVKDTLAIQNRRITDFRVDIGFSATLCSRCGEQIHENKIRSA
jgi:hypothetical protein